MSSPSPVCCHFIKAFFQIYKKIYRLHDVSRSGFNQWPFMSVHTWGEAPHGNWQLEIHNDGRFMGEFFFYSFFFTK